jgi:arabinogalactan endo-1,4-beta-galactosidase
MKRLSSIIISVIIALITTSCGDDESSTATPQEPEIVPIEPSTDDPLPSSDEINFAYGCDPSWLTEMENKSVKFYDINGNEKECLELLKSIGFNAARFRVWVEPSNPNGYGPWCNKADVVAKAKRAYSLGYKIMIDFHYSDNWADPAKQYKPAAWDAYTTIDELAEAAYNHTKDVLSAIKEADVDVEWVQIGNETTNGMMTSQSDQSTASLNCSFSTSTENYIKVHNTARKAAKEIYPDCKIVVHFDRGHNWDKFSWGLDKLVKGGAEFDIFGLSIYPVVTTSNWYSIYVDAIINNLQKVVDTYDKDVMICETGSVNIATYDAKRAINDIVVRAQGIERCKGVFYWEPECYASWNAYDMGGFLNNGRPSEALNVFDGKHTELLPAEDPNAAALVAENLYLYNMDGSLLGVCTPDNNGIWRGTVTTTEKYQNFKAQDGQGNKFAVENWVDWDSFVKATGTFDHFWFDGSIVDAGTYDVWFDPNTSTWGGDAHSK